MRTSSRLSALSLFSLLALAAASPACASADHDPDDATPATQEGPVDQEASAVLGVGGRRIDRVIPIRFVRHTTSATAIPQAVLDDQIAGANQIFADAGIAFTMAAIETVSGSPLAADGQVSWTPEQRAAALSFRPSCDLPTQTESRDRALWRAATYCGANEEILVFIVDGAQQAGGIYPWQGRGLVIQASPWLTTATPNRVLSHELGHLLGLPHACRGSGNIWDLSSGAIPPAQGFSEHSELKDLRTMQSAKLSAFWDLVYQPGGGPNGTNRFFTSEADAASVPESSLRPLQGNTGWSVDPLAFVCKTAGTCPAGVPLGALRIALPRTAPAWDACNGAGPLASCGCRPSQPGLSGQALHDDVSQRCDVLYTPNAAIAGLGFAPDAALGTDYAINVMSYNYSPGVTENPRWRLSPSQVAWLRRSLQIDVSVSAAWYPGATGARPRLGVGLGTWAPAWEALGGAPAAAARPAVRGAAGGRVDLAITTTTGALVNKVKNSESSGWWPSQTGWAAVSSSGTSSTTTSPTLVGRGTALALVTKNTAGQVRYLNWTGAWDGGTTLSSTVTGDPAAVGGGTNELDVVATAGTSGPVQLSTWNAATSSLGAWVSLGGSVIGGPTASRRPSGELDVLALGSDRIAYNKVRNVGGGWWPGQTGWASLGGQQLEEAPRVVSSTGVPVVIGRATTTPRKALLNKWSGSWLGWTDLGGDLAGPPSMVVQPTGRIDVVARGTDGSLLYKSWDSASTAWFPSETTWARLTVGITSDPVAVIPTDASSEPLDVYVRGTDGQLWRLTRR